MDLRQLLDSITPEIYEGLKRAIEIGKWPDGRPLAEGQKELCIQAVTPMMRVNHQSNEPVMCHQKLMPVNHQRW